MAVSFALWFLIKCWLIYFPIQYRNNTHLFAERNRSPSLVDNWLLHLHNLKGTRTDTRGGLWLIGYRGGYQLKTHHHPSIVMERIVATGTKKKKKWYLYKVCIENATPTTENKLHGAHVKNSVGGRMECQVNEKAHHVGRTEK